VRENKKRQTARRKGQRKKFKTPWREPKAVIIFVFDKQGKMIRRDRQPLIDGTLLGPDHLAELVAWHLHPLGAAKAEVVVFVSDGARWIWDRLDEIIRRAGLDPSRTARVLDWCHAVQHLHRALQSVKLNAQTRRAKFAELRGWLKRSRHAEVVAELERLAAGRPEKDKVWTEIRYLRTHGEAGHLQYRKFRRRGLPCGSGAIESTIRRVINLRLKSNAMYWLRTVEAFPVRACGMEARGAAWRRGGGGLVRSGQTDHRAGPVPGVGATASPRAAGGTVRGADGVEVGGRGAWQEITPGANGSGSGRSGL
jgi:hypothetical protein